MFKFNNSLFVSLSCTAILALGSAAAQAQSLGFGTSPPGSLYHSTGSSISKMASDHAGGQLTVQPFASPTVYLPAISSGNLAFGMTNIQEFGEAARGEAHFTGRDYSSLRGVAITFPLRVALFVRADSPYKTLQDLKGKKVVDGFTSQKTIPPQLDAMYAAAGMKRSDMVPVMVPNVVAGADAFMSGKVEAFYFALGAAKVQEAAASVGGIRALPIDNTPAALAGIQQHFPAAHLRLEQPSKPNIGVDQPLHVMTYDALVVASTKTAADDVYKLVKAMHANRKEMGANFPPLNLFNPGRMASNVAGAQWHAGAVRFYQEQGMWPPKQ